MRGGRDDADDPNSESFHAMTPAAHEEAHAPSSPARRRISIMLLLVGAVCAGMGQTIVFSVVPPLARDIGLTNFQVGLIFAISATFWVWSGPIWGRMSDRKGRKPFILIGMLGFAMSMALFGGAMALGLAGVLSGLPLYLLIISMRSIYGLVGSAGPPAAQAYIADRTSQHDRTAGIASFSAAFGFGAMLGPAFGAAASMIGRFAPFYAMSALGLVMMVMVFAFLPERTGPHQREARAKVRLTDPRLTHFLIFALVFSVVNAIPIQTIAFYFIDRLGYSTADAPHFVSIGLTAGAVASLFSQLVIVQRMRLSPARLMRIAPALMIGGHLMILMSDHLWPVVIGMIASGFGSGMAFPASTAAASLAVKPEEQGAAIGLASAASASGFIVTPAIAFSLYARAPQAPFVLTVVLAAAILVFAWRSRAIGAAVPGREDDLPPEAVEEPAAAPYS
ncbi:MAG: MFS transporter [Parvularculaceae bacterium]